MPQYVYRRNRSGTVESWAPLPYVGWKAKLEQHLRKWKFQKFANFLAAWDERGLGR